MIFYFELPNNTIVSNMWLKLFVKINFEYSLAFIASSQYSSNESELKFISSFLKICLMSLSFFFDKTNFLFLFFFINFFQN